MIWNLLGQYILSIREESTEGFLIKFGMKNKIYN